MIYRKSGRVVRWENGTLLRVSEEGLAVEEGDVFSAEPVSAAASRAAKGAASDLRAVARSIEGCIPEGVRIERLILTEGSAEHEVSRDTSSSSIRWSDETRRIHLSLVRERLRALVDLGSFEIEEIAAVAEALSRSEPEERPAPPHLRLAPSVVAALLPSLIGIELPNVQLWQTAGGIDGRGNPIEDVQLVHEPWPNWYRPSYRVRPVRMPLNVRIEWCGISKASKEIDSAGPIAVALLAPVDGLTLRVLVDEGNRAYPAAVRVARIEAVAERRRWYPYAAGSFGAEMML